MNPDDYRDSPTGTVRKTLQGYWTFIPSPLLPVLEYTPDLVALLSDADRALGALAGLERMLPNPNLLVEPYVRREAVRILSVRESYCQQMQKAKASASMLTLLDQLFLNPYITITGAAESLGVSFHSARAALERLETAGIIRKITGRQRNRVYCAVDLLRVIEGEATQG